MTSLRPKAASTLLGALLLFAPFSSQACTVCMGADPITGEALNAAIFVMLGCLGVMFTFIISVAVSIARRSGQGPLV